ncbi:MAG TPA: protease HtpX [Methanosarcinales archaeon]|nr:protease HtpX [Methanosarcinales archaeon]
MKNLLKTTILLATLTGLLILVGSFFGPGGMIIAFIFAIIMNFGSYWFSDKIVLWMYKVQEVSPQEAPELYRIVQNLVRSANLPMPKIGIMNSSMPNAFATGRDPEHAAVVVTTGIMQLLDSQELEGVLAHELAHVKNRDTLISAIAATIAGVITMLAYWAQWALIFGLGRDEEGGLSEIIGMLFMIIVAPIAATIIQLAISRSREYGADETGASISRKPWALASALSKLAYGNERWASRSHEKVNPSTAHMFIVNPLSGSAILALFSTHPPIEERIERLNKMRIY